MEKERSFNMFEDVSDVDGRNGTLGHFGDVVTGGKLFLAILQYQLMAKRYLMHQELEICFHKKRIKKYLNVVVVK